MSETSSDRPSLWFGVLAALGAAAIWATVAMAAGGSGSSGTGSPAASSDAPPAMYAADGAAPSDDCPNMGDGGGSTTPATPGAGTVDADDPGGPRTGRSRRSHATGRHSAGRWPCAAPKFWLTRP